MEERVRVSGIIGGVIPLSVDIDKVIACHSSKIRAEFENIFLCSSSIYCSNQVGMKFSPASDNLLLKLTEPQGCALLFFI